MHGFASLFGAEDFVLLKHQSCLLLADALDPGGTILTSRSTKYMYSPSLSLSLVCIERSLLYISAWVEI